MSMTGVTEIGTVWGVAELSVRAGTADDVAGIMDVLERSGERTGETVRRWIQSGGTRVAELGHTVVGVAITNPIFFGNDFVETLHVRSGWRRRGVASELLTTISAHRTTEKLFTSTNLSNTPMQTVLNRLGWGSAGIVYGLDEDDPELFYKAPPR